MVERGEAHLLDGAAHLGVRGDADALVELALLAEQLDRAHQLGLGRKLARHLLFHAPQDERRDEPRTRAQLVALVASLLDAPAGSARGTARRRRASPGMQEFEERPQLVEVVLDRRSGEAEPMLRPRSASTARVHEAPAVFDDLRFVEHQIVELCDR